MTTDGPDDAPLNVQSAQIAMRDIDADIDGNVLFDAAKAVAEFFTGRDFGREVSAAINGRSNDLTGDVRQAMQAVNGRLSRYTRSQGYRDVRPWYDRDNRELELRLTRPRVGPVVTDLKAPGTPWLPSASRSPNADRRWHNGGKRK